MSKHKKYYYLPFIYQREFSENKKNVWYISREMVNCGKEAEWRKIESMGEEDQDHSVDREFKAVEGQYLEFLQELLQFSHGDPIPHYVRNYFSYWMAVQVFRDTRTKESIDKQNSKPTNYTYVRTFQSVREIKEIFLACEWALLEAPKESYFVTSDLPVQSYGNPEAIYFPLSKKIIFCLSQAKDSSFLLHRGEIDNDWVQGLNQLQASRCHQFIIGHDKELVQSVMSLGI